MTPTPRFRLPLLEPGQAQKEMFHNEALSLIDIAVHAAVAAAGMNAPPTTPAIGQCWLVGPAPQGAWSGKPGAIAGWTEGGWRFIMPHEGMRVWLGREAGYAIRADGEWRMGEAHGRLLVNGVQTVGPRRAAIMEPNAGVTIDAEARRAISAILETLRGHGLIEGG